MSTPQRIRYEGRRTGKLKIGKAVFAERHGNGRQWTFSVEILRLREIEKIIQHRHGSCIPETDDDFYFEAVILSLSGQSMRDWCKRWAPWAVSRYDEIISPLERQYANRRYMQGADAVAKILMVTMAERTALDLHTVGACDVSRKERTEIATAAKRERDRTRQEQKRKSAGVKSRKSYEAESLSTLKPWEAEGISRAKWYRQKRETGPSLVVSTDRIGDTLVSPVQKAPQPVPQRPSILLIGSIGPLAATQGGAVERSEGRPEGQSPTPSDRHDLPLRPVGQESISEKKVG